MTEPQEKSFLPFWATPQYGGGLMQGMGIGLAGVFLLHEISGSIHFGALGMAGFVLLLLGGLKARKSST